MSPGVSTICGDQSVGDLRHELAEAREQQAATAEILRVISSSPTDLQRVFAVVAASAARLCDAYDAQIHLVDGDYLLLVAHHGPILAPSTLPLSAGVFIGRALLDQRTIHVVDLQAETVEYPESSGNARRLGFRTTLAVPLIGAGKAIGVISIRRTEVRPFTDRQIDLLKTFADQGVIAIENTRLFEAEQASKRELQESLEHQTATSDVLSVISRSPNELQPVLDAIVETARRLCQSDRAMFFQLREDRYHLAAERGTDPEFLAWVRDNPMSPELGSGSTVGRAARERRTIHVPDLAGDPEYNESPIQRRGRARSRLAVPLLRGHVVFGVILVARDAVRPFTNRQIKLVETFADQAVIAIENTRLFEAEQASKRELQEALEQQTATAEVLKVISRSALDVQKVLDALVVGSAPM